MLEAIIKYYPDYDFAYISIGSALALNKKYKEAIYYWQIFLDKFPNNEEKEKVKLWLEDVKKKVE